MSNDPYRGAPQSADRRVINRSGAASASNSTYRADEQPTVREELAPPTSTPRSSGSRRAERDNSGKSNKGLLWTIIALIAVVVIGVAGWFIWSNSSKGETGIDTSRYQAVFLANGQIYFGKLSSFNDSSFKITNIYYPQAETTGDATAKTDVNSEQSNIQLYRVTDGVHGPEDEMIITKSQILYYENLQANSKVTQLIEQNNKQ